MLVKAARLVCRFSNKPNHSKTIPAALVKNRDGLLANISNKTVANEEGMTSETKRFIEDQLKTREKEELVVKRSITNEDLTIVQVEGIPKDWTEGDIISYFDPKATKIVRANHLLNKLGNPTGRSMIEFKDRVAAEKFIAKYNKDYIELENMTSPLRVRSFVLQTNNRAFKAESLDKSVMIYDLHFGLSSKDLWDLLKDFGGIVDLYFPMRSKSMNKGYCVVQFETSQQVHDFMFKCTGMSLWGRELKFKTGSFMFSKQPGEKDPKERAKLKSTKILENAENKDIKIKNTLNDLIDQEIKNFQDAQKNKTENKSADKKAATI